MATQERSATDAVVAARERYVAAGVATPPLVVARAEGARVEDADGRSYIDFAGGLGCQNAGHGPPAVVAALHEQVDRYLHQCFMVGMYEPYVEVCRRLAELSPCRGAEQKSLLLSSGAEARRERGQDRAHRHRPAGGRRLRLRVPRPHAPGHDDDEQGRPLQARFRALRPRGLPRARPVPVPRRHDRRRDPRARGAVQIRCGSPGGRLRRARARPGRRRVRADAARLPPSSARAVRPPRDPLRRRRGAERRRPGPARSGRSSTTASSPTSSSPASRSAVGCHSPP